nr:MAG: E1 protein [Neophocaena asiaeorientalis asiaeorientalis papillomavirus 2]
MDNTSGTDPLEGGSNDWVLLEAEDAEGGGDDDDDEDDFDTGEDLVDFIDYTLCAEEGSEDADYFRRLQTEQRNADDERAVQDLKRKFLDSPKSKVDFELSPRLQAITLQARTGRARRKLYKDPGNDSGHGESLEASRLSAVVGSTQQVQEDDSMVSEGPWGGATPAVVLHSSNRQQTNRLPENPTSPVTNLLQAGKPRAVMLGIFKEVHGCCLTDLTRSFKSDKTVCEDWVCLLAGVPCALADAISQLLAPHTQYAHVTTTTTKVGMLAILLVRWKTGKNRDTVRKLLAGLFTIERQQMVLDPPRTRHPAAAMFWYKKALANTSIVTGETPEWILKQVSVQAQVGEACQFSLAVMVQWAYDNDLEGESDIAYEYALLADEDRNAEAFLRSNSQAKHVRDCASMVHHYKRAEMARMNMGQWIKHRCSKIDGDGDWKPIMRFLRFQGVDILAFLSFFKKFLRGVPKSSCLVLYGPPNTGKSMFGMGLISMLAGKVISHVNSGSHFWLQPLGDCKVAMLDDATTATWDYIDTYLRSVLDGNPVCLDAKHKAPRQIKCPPLLITTNVNVMETERFKYLHSRIRMESFMHTCPLDCRGDPEYNLSKENWKAFFFKCWASLSLDDLLQGDGEPMQQLRCAARETDGPD